MSHRMDSVFGDVEDFIESFEQARCADRNVSIRDFLPDQQCSHYLEVLQELVRVDLDQRFRDGQITSLRSHDNCGVAGSEFDSINASCCESFRDQRRYKTHHADDA